jgi:hydroxypyruvate isomerase
MPRYCANLSWMFTEVAPAFRCAAAAEAEFAGVEMLFPYVDRPEIVAGWLAAACVEMVLINTPPGDASAGEMGLAAIPGAEVRFEAALDEALCYARVLGVSRLHVMSGLARGDAARRVLVANLRRACVRAAEELPGLVLTVEPINDRDMPGYHIARSDEALEVIAAVGESNLQLQLDLYHAQIMEGDLTRLIERAAPLLGHVQVAGVPERNEPDRGELAFRHLMEVLDRVGYDGWVAGEYRPAGRTEDGLGWMAR